MVAVLGHEPDARLLARELGLTIANHHAIGQLVLSGAETQIEAASELARDRKLKSMKLPIAGAFHSPSMRGAVEPFRRVLDAVSFSAPSVPVYSCTTAKPFGDIRATLADALVRPVRWTETLGALDAAGVTSFVEPGPGKVLTGLVKRTLPGAEATALEARRG
jgi:[acyl-carrier-protein] S-malonyltransferase